MTDSHSWEPFREMDFRLLPIQLIALSSPPKKPKPHFLGEMLKALERVTITWDAVIVEVSLNNSPKPCTLFGDRFVESFSEFCSYLGNFIPHAL